MPTLLYRYILTDLLRVFALTTAVLVTVIAFGATVKPLTGDGIMGIGETVKFLLLAIIPMLQFALPFSAGFASTIVLHRMTNDNEILAAAASGISYRRLLMPIAGLGVLLTLIMVLLTQSVIPRFAGLMERTITADITRIFEARIESGQPFELGNLQIYADNMRVVVNPSDTEAQTRLVLMRVAAAELDRDGRIETDITAHQAVVDVHRIGDQTYLNLVLTDTVAFDGQPGQLARLPLVEPSQAILVPSFFRDETRAMTRSQLLRLRENPDTHSRIAEGRQALAEAFRDAKIWSTIQQRLTENGQLQLHQASPTRRSYVISASGVRNGQFIPAAGQDVLVRQYEGETLFRRITARQAMLNRVGGTTLGSTTFELVLLDCEVTDLRGEATVNRRERLADHDLSIDRLDTEELFSRSSHALLAQVDDDAPPRVRSSADRLETRLIDLDNEISGRLLNRYAQSATVLLLLVIGATLAMWLRGAMPLVIYIWAFAPSILALILASGGEKMVRDGVFAGGLAVMWSGNIALALLVLLAFSRLRKN